MLNHGLIEPIGPLQSIAASSVRSALDVNVVSFSALLGGILQQLRDLAVAMPALRLQATVVNISSLAAYEPSFFPGWGVYSAGKAARVALMDAAAAEAEAMARQTAEGSPACLSVPWTDFSPLPLNHRRAGIP